MISFVQHARVDRNPAHAGAFRWSAASIPVGAVLALVVVLPFEVPLTSVGWGLTLTTVELAIALVVIVSSSAIVSARRPLLWQTPITKAVLACLAAAFVSAWLSPVDRGNAMRLAARMLAAAAIMAIVVNAVSTRSEARVVVRTLVGIAFGVAIVAVLEAAQLPVIGDALTLFRPGFHVVGGQLRATSTLIYPTVASMYLEVAFALGLWLLLDRGADQKRWRAIAMFIALATIGAGIIATFTRAGLLAIGVALMLAGALHYAKARRLDAAHVRLAALAGVLVALILASRSPDVLLARLSTEGSQEWYGATYAAPTSLAFATGGWYQVPVTIENNGRVVWDSSSVPMFAMSYHWVRAGTETVVEFDGWRTPFTAPVLPGARVTLPVAVKAPGTPGRYVLVWDVVHEHRAWLSTEGVVPARSLVDVTGPAVSATTSAMPRLPTVSPRADRFTLWRAALQIAWSHPLLGIGPDNFRQTYGRYINAQAFDTRVHANNMYLEVLAGGGVVGLCALFWLMAASAMALVERWRRAGPAVAPATAALCAAWLVVAVHGLVDSFLSFTTTYVMFAIAAGLAFSPGLADADRV